MMDVILTLMFYLALYFLPALIGAAREHHNRWAIFWLNLFLGWTILGWIAAFIWACTAIRDNTLTLYPIDARQTCPQPKRAS